MTSPHLKRVLVELEQERKSIAKAKIIGYAIGVGALLISIIDLFTQSNPFAWITSAAIALIVSFYINSKSSDKEDAYVDAFKQNIIKAFLLNIDPGLAINLTHGLSIVEFNNSGLFDVKADKLHSEDQISGRIENTNISFSEVNASYISSFSGRSRAGAREISHRIFKGLIFVSDVSRSIYGITVVRPKTLRSAFSAWRAKNFPSMSSSSHQLVEFKHKKFSSQFVVYSNDHSEARSILTSAVMNLLCQTNFTTKRKISLSFINQKVYLALPLSREFFDPPLFRTLIDPDLLKTDIETIKLMCGVIRELNRELNHYG